MKKEFVNLTPENLDNEHLCCIIRKTKTPPGIEKKKLWLSERLKEGHTFRKLNEEATVFIEYAPLEKAWVPIWGDNYYYIYCLWVLGNYKGKGYGKALMDYCVEDAKKNGKSGICMLGSEKQKNWLSDQSFAKKYGFVEADATDSGYRLLALSLDGTLPKFADKVKEGKIKSQDLTIYYSAQCPYTYQSVERAKRYCQENSVAVDFIQVDTLEKAKELPCVFNNYALFYKGEFKTVNLADAAALEKILKK